jgi:hypothetical protein
MSAKSMELLQRLEALGSHLKVLTHDERCVLDAELDETLESIANCDSVEAAEPLLLDLGDIQLVLATLAFKHGIELSKRQRAIVREYDRCDVPEVRHDIFANVRTHTFPWCREDT